MIGPTSRYFLSFLKLDPMKFFITNKRAPWLWLLLLNAFISRIFEWNSTCNVVSFIRKLQKYWTWAKNVFVCLSVCFFICAFLLIFVFFKPETFPLDHREAFRGLVAGHILPVYEIEDRRKRSHFRPEKRYLEINQHELFRVRYFHSLLQNQVDIRGIRTRFVGLDDERADHKTSTTVLTITIYLMWLKKVVSAFVDVWDWPNG